MEKSTRRTWISIVIASVIIVGILAVAAVGGTAYFFYRHINAQYAPRESADEQFAAARARFSGQKPLIEIRRDDEPIVHRELFAEAHSNAKLETLRVLAYDPDERKLVRVTIPFWIAFLNAAEHHRWVARLLHPYVLRGTVFYHFVKGCTESMRRQRGSSSLSGSTAAPTITRS